MHSTCRQKGGLACLVLAGLLGIVLIVLGAVSMTLLPSFFAEQVAKKLPLVNGSASYQNWVNTNVPIYFKVHLFSLTNEEAVLQGARPNFVEKGPYSYREVREKVNYTFRENETRLWYLEKRYYIFDPETSNGDPYTDNVTTLNLVINTLLPNVENHSWIDKVLNFFPIEKIFMTRTVNEILWGYEDAILSVCKRIIGMCPTAYSGLLINTNGTVGVPYEISTGKNQIDTIGDIMLYNGTSKLDIWTSGLANSINGSDGSMFKPNLQSSDIIYVFAGDICRSFALGYSRTIKATNDHRISLNQYIGTRDQSENATVNPYNRGFCPANPIGPECPPAGLMDLSTCRKTGPLMVPLFASQPRFYLADPEVSAKFDGLRTPSEADQTVINIEPNTGLPLEAFKRLQMNFYVKPTDGLKSYYVNMKRTESYFPLMWVEEGVEADSKTLDDFYNQVLSKKTLIDNLIVGLLTSGVCLFLFSVIGIIIWRVKVLSGTRYIVVTTSAQPILNNSNQYSDEGFDEVNGTPILGVGGRKDKQEKNI